MYQLLLLYILINAFLRNTSLYSTECTDQGVNPGLQTLQGYPVTKSETSPQNILVGNVNPIQGSSTTTS